MLDVVLGACDWGLPGEGLFAQRIAAEAGLSCLSLRAGLWENDYPITHREMQAIYREEAERWNIAYVALALNDLDNIPMHARKGDTRREAVWTLLRRAAPTAKALGIPLVQVPAFGASTIKTEEDMRHSADALRYLCDAAGELGLEVASENVLTPQEFATLREMVDRDNFFLYYDSQNYQLNHGWDQVEILESCYGWMCGQLHVKDGNNALSGALLGQGNSDFAGTMRTLYNRGYKGYILLENYYDQLPLRLAADNPYDLLREDVRLLKEAVAQQ